MRTIKELHFWVVSLAFLISRMNRIRNRWRSFFYSISFFSFFLLLLLLLKPLKALLTPLPFDERYRRNVFSRCKCSHSSGISYDDENVARNEMTRQMSHQECQLQPFSRVHVIYLCFSGCHAFFTIILFLFLENSNINDTWLLMLLLEKEWRTRVKNMSGIEFSSTCSMLAFSAFITTWQTNCVWFSCIISWWSSK